MQYYSCSFVKISGGAPLASSYTPVFINDLQNLSPDGCMSANDEVGKCPVEPCIGPIASYVKPVQFANGQTPTPLTPETYGGSGGGPSSLTNDGNSTTTTTATSTTSVIGSTGNCAANSEQCDPLTCCDNSAVCERVEGSMYPGKVCSTSGSDMPGATTTISTTVVGDDTNFSTGPDESNCAKERGLCDPKSCCDGMQCGRVDGDGIVGKVCHY
jgi:hypothetical protein